MICRITLFLILISSVGAYAQLETSADFRRQIYDREYTIGIVGHSRGYTITGRYYKYMDGYNKQGLEIDLVKLRHPKEVKTPNQLFSNTKGFVYGRDHSLFAFRSGYAREKIIFDKTDQGTVSIAWNYSGGLSLGLLKPVYLQVYEDLSTGSAGVGVVKIERYNPSKHDVSNIYGEANFFYGLGNVKVKPGIYAKTGATFDFDLLDKKVTSVEVGVCYDFYFTEVPIFHEPDNGEDLNKVGFLQLYLAVNFGYKKN